MAYEGKVLVVYHKRMETTEDKGAQEIVEGVLIAPNDAILKQLGLIPHYTNRPAVAILNGEQLRPMIKKFKGSGDTMEGLELVMKEGFPDTPNLTISNSRADAIKYANGMYEGKTPSQQKPKS